MRFGYRLVAEAEKVRLVQRHFDDVASRYDLVNSLLSLGLHHVWKRKAVRLLQLKPGEVVLDVCGGTADLAILAARLVRPSGRALVYDLNRAMMEAGRDKVAALPPNPGIGFIQGDAEQLALADGSVDAVIVGFGIRNLTHMPQGLQEMYRVLKPGGRLVCLEFSTPPAVWFRRLYDLYSFYLMPLVGRLLVGSWQAYAYLFESIRVFPLPAELAALLREIGFSRVAYLPLTQGIAVAHLGKKS